MSLERVKDRSTGQAVELGKRDDVINRLKIQREVLNVDVITLKGQLEALKQKPIASSKGVKAIARVRSLPDLLAAQSNIILVVSSGEAVDALHPVFEVPAVSV